MINQNYVQQLVGKPIYAVTRDGYTVYGQLQKVKGDKIVLRRLDADKAQVSAFFPGFGGFGGFDGGFGGFGFGPQTFITTLALFDLLAIGTAPFLW